MLLDSLNCNAADTQTWSQKRCRWGQLCNTSADPLLRVGAAVTQGCGAQGQVERRVGCDRPWASPGVPPSCRAEPAVGVPSSPHGRAAVVGQRLCPGGPMGLAAAIPENKRPCIPGHVLLPALVLSSPAPG